MMKSATKVSTRNRIASSKKTNRVRFKFIKSRLFISEEERLYALNLRYCELYSNGEVSISDVPSEIRTYDQFFYRDALKLAQKNASSADFEKVVRLLEDDILKHPNARAAHTLLRLHYHAYMWYYPEPKSNR